jgi:hypothetical protein
VIGLGAGAALSGDGPLLPGRRLGPRVSGWLPVFGLALALVALLLWWMLPGAPGLGGRHLVGDRGPACLRLVVAVDLSGSMNDYGDARDHALRELLTWAADGNLRADDEIAVVDFAAAAAPRLPVTPVPAAAAAAALTPVPVPDGRFTNLAPVLDTVSAMPAGRCDQALLLLSDAQLGDLPPDEPQGRAVLAAHDVHDVVLLVPGDGIAVPAAWTSAFPAAPPIRFDGHDADATALAIGRAVAHLTGQTLEES